MTKRQSNKAERFANAAPNTLFTSIIDSGYDGSRLAAVPDVLDDRPQGLGPPFGARVLWLPRADGRA